MLIVAWRQWPLWHALERDGGSLDEQWRALDWFDVDAWRGLGVAALVSAILATVLLLAWPDLLTQQQRWVLAALCFIAAVTGDAVGYYFGHKVGRGLFQREDSRCFKKKYLTQNPIADSDARS